MHGGGDEPATRVGAETRLLQRRGGARVRASIAAWVGGGKEEGRL